MCLTRSIPCTKPPSTASHSSLPIGGSPLRARTFRHPCCFASYGKQNDVSVLLFHQHEAKRGYLKSNVNLFLGHVGTRKMHAGLDSNETLAYLDHFRRKVGSSSTCIPVSRG